MLPPLRFALCIALASLVTACGFQLRGVGDSSLGLPDSWRSMALVTGNANSEFSREVLSRFASSGVQWTGRESANFALVLGPERFAQRNLSLSSEARAAEFELTMSATFSVLDQRGRDAMAQTTAAVVKVMENDPRNVVGKSEEIRLLQREMRAELAQQIVRRIAFHAASLDADPAASG